MDGAVGKTQRLTALVTPFLTAGCLIGSFFAARVVTDLWPLGGTILAAGTVYGNRLWSLWDSLVAFRQSKTQPERGWAFAVLAIHILFSIVYWSSCFTSTYEDALTVCFPLCLAISDADLAGALCPMCSWNNASVHSLCRRLDSGAARPSSPVVPAFLF